MSISVISCLVTSFTQGHLPYRTIDEHFNRTSSRIVQVAAASELAHEFCIVLPAKVKIKNTTSSVYSRVQPH